MTEQVRTKFLGDFGEYLLTWYLRSRFGINVGVVKGEGIDLLCSDEQGRSKRFPKGKLIAISVKTRERRKDLARKYVNVDWGKIEKTSKKWKAKPYFAYIRIVPEIGQIRFFLLSVSKAKNYSKNFSVAKAEKEDSNILFTMNFDSYPRLEDWRITNR